jgi:hypothetical protein
MDVHPRLTNLCRRSVWPVLAVALILAGWTVRASAQVVIYRISFSDLEDYNVDFYDGGYLVTPILGGTPSLILVNRAPDLGATYTSAVSGGEFFVGLDSQKRLLATFTCRGKETSALCAFGPVQSSLRLKSSSFDLQVRVARLLTGGLIAASSEGGQKGPDGTSGFAQHSQVKLEIDDALTSEANTFGGLIGDGVSVINGFLESHGYRPEDPDPSPPAALTPAM